MSKPRFVAGVSIIMIICMMLVVSFPPPKVVLDPSGTAQFVLSEWDWPDEHGQGIYGFRFYENSTGSWVAAPFYAYVGEFYGEFYFLHSYDEYTLNWSAGVAMKLRAYSTFNSTLTGAIHVDDGENYQRHNVIVTSEGTTLFSQQNFTWYDVTTIGDNPIWDYEYEVVLNFLPVDGGIYTVITTYEIYW